MRIVQNGRKKNNRCFVRSEISFIFLSIYNSFYNPLVDVIITGEIRIKKDKSMFYRRILNWSILFLYRRYYYIKIISFKI